MEVERECSPGVLGSPQLASQDLGGGIDCKSDQALAHCCHRKTPSLILWVTLCTTDLCNWVIIGCFGTFRMFKIKRNNYVFIILWICTHKEFSTFEYFMFLHLSWRSFLLLASLAEDFSSNRTFLQFIFLGRFLSYFVLSSVSKA